MMPDPSTSTIPRSEGSGAASDPSTTAPRMEGPGEHSDALSSDPPGPSTQWMVVPQHPYAADGPYELWMLHFVAPTKEDAVRRLAERGEVIVDGVAPWRGTLTPRA